MNENVKTNAEIGDNELEKVSGGLTPEEAQRRIEEEKERRRLMGLFETVGNSSGNGEAAPVDNARFGLRK